MSKKKRVQGKQQQQGSQDRWVELPALVRIEAKLLPAFRSGHAVGAGHLTPDAEASARAFRDSQDAAFASMWDDGYEFAKRYKGPVQIVPI